MISYDEGNICGFIVMVERGVRGDRTLIRVVRPPITPNYTLHTLLHSNELAWPTPSPKALFSSAGPLPVTTLTYTRPL